MKIARRREPGATSVLSTKTFVGEVWTDLVMAPTDDGTRATNVFFAPGGRTLWHSHEGGQLLVVGTGSGLIATRGGRPQVLEVGDVVWISAGEEHWHGGSADCSMSHLAVSFGETTYLEPITDEEYSAAPADR
jgi:quercetin dioxygenase-like cupin family protein